MEKDLSFPNHHRDFIAIFSSYTMIFLLHFFILYGTVTAGSDHNRKAYYKRGMYKIFSNTRDKSR